MSRATEDALAALHGALASAFSDYLAKVKSGDVEVNASVFKEIRSFLQDNGIEQSPQPTNPMGKLLKDADALPFPGESPRH